MQKPWKAPSVPLQGHTQRHILYSAGDIWSPDVQDGVVALVPSAWVSSFSTGLFSCTLRTASVFSCCLSPLKPVSMASPTISVATLFLRIKSVFCTGSRRGFSETQGHSCTCSGTGFVACHLGMLDPPKSNVCTCARSVTLRSLHCSQPSLS